VTFAVGQKRKGAQPAVMPCSASQAIDIRSVEPSMSRNQFCHETTGSFAPSSNRAQTSTSARTARTPDGPAEDTQSSQTSPGWRMKSLVKLPPIFETLPAASRKAASIPSIRTWRSVVLRTCTRMVSGLPLTRSGFEITSLTADRPIAAAGLGRTMPVAVMLRMVVDGGSKRMMPALNGARAPGARFLSAAKPSRSSIGAFGPGRWRTMTVALTRYAEVFLSSPTMRRVLPCFHWR